MRWLGYLSLGSILFLTVYGCGSDNDGGGTRAAPPPLTGLFIDSPVQGLSYSASPSGLSGLTGPNGEFRYRAGDRMTFRIGNWPIGLDALAQPLMTPFTFMSSTTVPSTTDQAPVDVARLLLALDTIPGVDTITLPATMPSLPLQPSWGSPAFETDLQNAGIPIVPTTQAIAHLKSQFAIWGSWATTGSPTQLKVLTFLPDGTFMLAHDADPLIPEGVDGMERGTYAWNAATHVFTYSVTVNTDGPGGLSPLGSGSTSPYSFVIDPSGNSATLRLGPTPSDQLSLIRVNDATTPLVGAWRLLVPADSGVLIVLTLLSDGTWTAAVDEASFGSAGMERGTYTVDQATGNVTFITMVDTNGTGGLNDTPTLPAQIVVHIQVNGDHMDADAGNGSVFFDRVRVP